MYCSMYVVDNFSCDPLHIYMDNVQNMFYGPFVLWTSMCRDQPYLYKLVRQRPSYCHHSHLQNPNPRNPRTR